MRLVLDPMVTLRDACVLAVNQHFARQSGIAVHSDAVHARKITIAERVLAEGESTAPAPFADEAALRGLSVAALAQLVKQKAQGGDALLTREYARQSTLLEVEAAKSIDQLRDALAKIGLSVPALNGG